MPDPIPAAETVSVGLDESASITILSGQVYYHGRTPSRYRGRVYNSPDLTPYEPELGE